MDDKQSSQASQAQASSASSPATSTSPASASPDGDVPWQQRLFDNIWLLALAAMLYFFLSYALWGLIDLARVPAGG